MKRPERLAEFVKRMLTVQGCSTFEEAFALLANTLIAVEDQFSGIAFDPTYPRDDGRMYPPGPDARRVVPGRPELQRYRSAAHNTYVSDTGAILIVDLEGTSLLDKADSKARTITI